MILGRRSIGDYDECGNPRMYKGEKLLWSRGRMLDRYGEIRYTYDKDGMRTARHREDRPGVSLRNYVYEGRKLVAERWMDSSNRINFNYYRYDGGGLCGFSHAVYDGNGVAVAESHYAVLCDSFGSVRQVRVLGVGCWWCGDIGGGV